MCLRVCDRPTAFGPRRLKAYRKKMKTKYSELGQTKDAMFVISGVRDGRGSRCFTWVVIET